MQAVARMRGTPLIGSLIIIVLAGVVAIAAAPPASASETGSDSLGSSILSHRDKHAQHSWTVDNRTFVVNSGGDQGAVAGPPDRIFFISPYARSTQTSGTAAQRSSVRAEWRVNGISPTSVKSFQSWLVSSISCNLSQREVSGNQIHLEWSGTVCDITRAIVTSTTLWVEGGHRVNASHWTFGVAVH